MGWEELSMGKDPAIKAFEQGLLYVRSTSKQKQSTQNNNTLILTGLA